ncbi:MAG TPA: hypothetical protein VGT24_07045 [Candidatus Acidoferrales bacterium]|nr:hypothetical protein [Candidatus Acidoferrales bacterium]
MNTLEQLALWYLRLNGYFTMPNFIAHGEGGPRTDVDVLGVRFPHSREYPDDKDRLQISPQKIDVVFAEVKTGRCKLNGPWKAGGNRQALEYVLRRTGTIESDNSIFAVANELYTKQRYENGTYVVRIICFGGKPNGTLPKVTQILWPNVVSFINQRFQTYLGDKAEHQHWDSFGQYLWVRLSGNYVPTVDDIARGWEAKCPCWP